MLLLLEDYGYRSIISANIALLNIFVARLLLAATCTIKILHFMAEYIDNTHEDTQIQFIDLLTMRMQIILKLEFIVANKKISLRDVLIELQIDEIMLAQFNDGKYIWKTKQNA